MERRNASNFHRRASLSLQRPISRTACHETRKVHSGVSSFAPHQQPQNAPTGTAPDSSPPAAASSMAATDGSRSGSSTVASDTDINRLREGPVRLLGYANELGESFRPLVKPWIVNASYAVAGAYVTADAAWRSSMPPPGRKSIVEAVDTLLWQGLASVAVPGFVINRVVWSVGRFGPAQYRAWLPTATGLASIPFIIKPIDNSIDLLMDKVIRPVYDSKNN